MTLVASVGPRLIYTVIALVCLAMLGALQPAPVAAAEWREKATRYVIIYHQPEHSNTADQLAALVDPVAEQMATLHDAPPRKPFPVRLYANNDAYAQSSALARTPYGQVAQAGGSPAELAISEPRLRNLTPEQTRNVFRRGLSQLMLEEASQGKLALPYLHGAALYSERPSPEVEVGARALDRARREGGLLKWADLTNTERFAAQAEIAAAQSLSIVSFLHDRYGLAPWQRFVAASRTAPDAATALAQGYGRPATTLESEWESFLPEYFGGSFNINYFARYDLGPVRESMTAGRYFEARDELEAVARYIAGANRTAKETELRDSARLVAQGLEADLMLQQGQSQLASFQYATARDTFDAARQRFEVIGAGTKIEEVGQATTAAAAGVEAVEQLNASKQLLAELKYAEARTAAVAAIKTFASLGDEEHYRQSYLIIQELDSNVTRVASLAGLLALAGAIVAAWRMATYSRRTPVPGVLQ